MRPAVFICPVHLVVAALPEKTANGNMHQILLFFFGKSPADKPQLLDPDQE